MKRQDLTQGVIWKQLLLFALPLLASSFIQQLYNTVDLLFAGTLGKEATAAVGASSLVITCVVGFFTGLSVGVSVVVSQAVGARNGAKICRAVHTGVAVSLIIGGALAVLGIALARVILGWMQTPEEIMADSVAYVRLYLLCMVPLVLYNMNAGIIRAAGDSRTPMRVQLVGGVTNVILDALAVLVFHAGIRGVALASTVSQGVAAWLTVRYLQKAEGDFHLDLRRIRIDGGILWEVVRIGAPAGLQNLVITLSNVFVQYKINGFGVDSVAAFASYFKVELLNYLPIVAFGQAMMTFSGQNIGAGKADRVKKGVRVCILMGAAYVVCSAGLLLLFGKQAFWVFNRDPGVIACGLRIIRVTFPFYWLYVILEVLADATRGAGKSLPPMLIILFNICVLRTVLLFAFTARWHVLEAVAATYPIAWFTAALCLLIYWLRGAWKPQSGKEEQHESNRDQPELV